MIKQWTEQTDSGKSTFKVDMDLNVYGFFGKFSLRIDTTELFKLI